MSDQALAPTEHCTNFKCQKWVDFGGEAMLSKPQLMLKGKYWCCPKCGSSYGEHAKEGLMEQSKVKLPELSELEALRIVCRLARSAVVDHELLLTDLKKKYNGHGFDIQCQAIAQVEELIETTDEAEKDPVKHGLDFLKEQGCHVALAVHADNVADAALNAISEGDVDMKTAKEFRQAHRQATMECIDEACQAMWSSEELTVVSDNVQSLAATMLKMALTKEEACSSGEHATT